MKKHVLFALGLCLFALSIAPVLSVAQEDMPDSKDHPLLTRMPNFYISDYEYKEFDTADFKDEKGDDNENYAEFIIAKHRNGSLEEVPMQFIKRFAKFMNQYQGFNEREALTANIRKSQNDRESSSMQPNSDFENSASQGITIQSRMNQDSEKLPEDNEQDFDEMPDPQNFYPDKEEPAF